MPDSPRPSAPENTVILGLQWGDEGKGKIVDLLCPAFDAVTRFQGGHNAGHTVKFEDRHFSLHLIPSGIVRPGMDCVLGGGMVISPEAFLGELEGLREAGVEFEGRLSVSERAAAILPFHAVLDRAREAARGAGAIGTTSRGIGPAYEDKAARRGLRLGDLGRGDLEADLGPMLAAVEAEVEFLRTRTREAGGEPIEEGLGSAAELAAACARWAEALAPYLADTTGLLHGWLDAGRRILFEGAQGTLLDLDHGTYPYVTSSSSSAGGAATGTGVAPSRLGLVLGVLKAYTTRVGGGPFVTELAGERGGEVGEHLRRRGNEFGTTTGRPRRCGWLDLPAARYACRLNGVDALAVTKLDVLDELEEISICVGYRIDGRETDRFPADGRVLARAEPILETLPGWRRDTTGVGSVGELPEAARAYLERIEREVGAPVALLSTGPRREETLLVDGPRLERLLGGRREGVAAGLGGAAG